MRTLNSMKLFVHLLSSALALLCAQGLPRAAQAATSCTSPGKDGPGALTGVVNSYYPGASGTVYAGSTSVPVGALDSFGGGSTTPIGAGDLVLIMQMQDADFSFGNSSAYGGSFPGGGQTALNSAGLYETASVALSYAGGSPIPLTAPLKNTYRTAAATGSAGQRTYQVIRVPQLSSASLSGTLTAAGWNGATGGVLAFDVAGQLNWNGGTIDVTGLGFRGGAALYLKGRATSQPAYAWTDYAATLLPVSPTISPNPGSTVGPNPGAHGTKGEGIAGTPRYLFVPTTPRSTVNGAGAVFDTGVEGYPGGSMGRGAPGNAGGGGSDGHPGATYGGGNDQNTGGGGGGGYAIGGMGGYGWTPLTPPGSFSGGFGGDGIPMFAGRLTLGGGGGSGSTNNGTGGPTYGLASSGAPGGGIVLVRARTIIGSGTINARGTAGNPGVCNDASGGGGGGGSVLLYASGNNGNVGTVTVDAGGGAGGSNTGNGSENSATCGAYNQEPHGPGGGGGGGFVALSSISNATILVSGAANGTTSPSPTSTAPYGSSSSPGGYQINSVISTDLPGASPSPLCYPLLTVTKSTSSPNTVQGGATKYAITVANAVGYGVATGVTATDVLPVPFVFASTDSIALLGGATRTAVITPSAGAATPAWGTFTIPPGGSIRIDLTVDIPPATPLATFQNPATASYDDPTRSAPGQTVTPGGTYAGGGFVAGTNYAPSSSTAEDVTVLLPASIAKTFSPVSVNPGGTALLTLAVTNPNGVALTAAAFTDVFPGGMTATGGALTVSGAGCTGFAPNTLIAGATSLAVSGGTVPANTTCTFSANVTVSSAISSTNTLAARAFTNALGVTNPAPISATLLSRPTLVKSFSPVAVPTNTDATLSFAVANPNATPLTNAAFTDAFPTGLVATGGAVTIAGASCTGFLPATIAANATSFALTAGNLPANATCTISFAVRSATQGPYVNSASGVVTTETVLPGLGSNAAQLGVGVLGITKAFAPARIAVGGASVVTLTLVNPTGTAQTAGAFTDTLAGMSISNYQTVGGTCTGVTPASLSALATHLSFTGINVPAAGCTITFSVTSATTGTQTNTTTGVSTSLLPAGSASNTASLVVTAPPTISEAFSPSTIQTGEPSTLTFTLLNADSIPLTGAAFTDTLTGGLKIAATSTVGGSCPGAGTLSVTLGATALSFTGLSIPLGPSGCTITVPVTANTPGSHPNAASGVSSNETSTGPAAPAAALVVAASPTIAKAFSPSFIAANGASTLTFTLTNPNAIELTSAAFNDPLNKLAINATGPAGGTCSGAASNTFLAGATGTLTFSGLTLPASSSCTVTVVVTSTTSGSNPNTASGVTSAQTPTAGAASNTASLSVYWPPALSLAFSPGTILSTTAAPGSTSTLTITLTNTNAIPLTSVAFTDALSGMSIAATGPAAGTCTGASGNTFTAAATSLSFAGMTVPANGSCTVTVAVSSASLSPAVGWTDATSGATSTQTPIAGAASNTDALTVIGFATIAKAFSPPSVVTGGTSTITFTLSNPTSISLTSLAFSDTFPTTPGAMRTTAAAQNFIGAGRGTCTGAIPSAAIANSQTASVSFSGISLPANGSCTVTVDVTVPSTGSYLNAATGVKSTQTGATAGPASNTATLSGGRLGIAKTFTPSSIGVGDPSTLTFTLTNSRGQNATAVTFTDTFPSGMTAVGGAVTVTGAGCSGFAPTTVTVGATTFTVTTGTVAANSTCLVSLQVTASSAGALLNTTGAITSSFGAGPASNSAQLTVVLKPTIAMAFSPTPVDAYRNSTLTFTLNNPNASTPLTTCTFTDTLTGFFVSNPPSIGGTCVGVTSTPALAQGQTSLSLQVPTLNAGACTISLPVTASAAGTYTNTASGVSCAQTASAGAASNTASVTFNKLSLQLLKTANVVTAPPGSTVTYSLGYANPNTGMSLKNLVIADTTPQFTGFKSASCGALPASITSCTISAPAVGLPGVVTWTLGGNLDPGASGTLALSVTVN